MKKKIVFLIITFSFLGLPQKVFAQGISLGIYPPILEAIIKPGKYITQVFTIYNNSETNIVLKSSIFSFKPDGEHGRVTLSQSKAALAPLNFSYLNSDLEPDQPFTVKARSSQQIVLTIKPSETAPEKDYYATLLFETQPVKSFLPFSNTASKTKIGSNLLISVSSTGELKKSAEITAFSLKNSFIIDSFDNISFIVRIKNTGHSFLKPFGQITTKGWFKQKYENKLLPENILSDSIRNINCAEEEGENINPIVCVINSKFLLGAYQSDLEFKPVRNRYAQNVAGGIDQNSIPLQKSIKFIAFPWKLALALIILILITKLFLKPARNRYAQNVAGGPVRRPAEKDKVL